MKLENQTKVDNTMPERAMGYDYAGYEEQVRRIMEENRVAEKPAFAKRLHDGQKLAPVLSAVVFYGRKWTGPRRLHDMLEFPSEAAQFLRDKTAPPRVFQCGAKPSSERRFIYHTDYG